MFTKKIWQSKTFWLNVLGVVLSVLELFDVGILTTLGFKDPVKAFAISGTIQSILNIILRFGNPAPINNKVPSGTHISNVPQVEAEMKRG